MAYPCDLPANMGNTDIFRAIYNKIGNSDISTGRIEQKLNIISGQLANVNDQLIVVNNSIEANTQAIKDISINVDIHSKDIQGITKAINKQTKAIENIQIHIDTSDLNDSVQLVAAKVEDGFIKTVEAINSIHPGPTPPVPPCPEPILYTVPIGLPGPTVYYKPKKKRYHIKSNSNKVIVPKDEEDWYHRPHNPNLEPWKVEYYKSLHTQPKPKAPKRVNCQY